MNQKKKILVVGDGVLDKYVYVETTRNCPESIDLPIFDVIKQEYRPGGALNTALNVASLGDEDVEVFYCGPCNHRVIKQMKSVNIFSFARYENDNDFLVKERYYRNQQLLCRADYNKKYEYTDTVKSFFINQTQSQWSNFDAVIFSDYDKGTIDKNLVDFITSNVRKDCLIVVDSKRIDLSIYKGVDIIKLNNKEYTTQLENLVEPQTLCNFCIVTTGKEGAVIIEQHGNTTNKIYVKPKNANEIDVTGCGDTHTAALTVYLLHNNNIYAATKYANCAAAVAVSKFGTSYVKKTEVIYE